MGTPVPSICTYKDGYRLTEDNGQIQLHGAIDFLLLSACAVGADGFGSALYRLRGYFQAR